MSTAAALPPAQYFAADQQNRSIIDTSSTSSWSYVQNSYTSGIVKSIRVQRLS